MENKHKTPFLKDILRQRMLHRFLMVIAASLIVAAIIAIKSFSISVLDREHWLCINDKIAEKQFKAPKRGDILARDGRILSTSQPCYTLRLDYRSSRFDQQLFLDSIDTLSDSLASHFPMRTTAEWKEHLARPLEQEKHLRSRSHIVIRNISYEDMRQVRKYPYFNIKNRIKSGLLIERHSKREFPYGRLAQRTIGTTYEDNNGNISGLCGIEEGYNNFLCGVKGVARKHGPIDGCDILTTIDIDAQKIVEAQLDSTIYLSKADWGTAILMDVKTGDIVAIANRKRSPIMALGDESINHALRNYEPGGLFKTISMTLALEDNLINDTSQIIPIGKSFAYAEGPVITDSHYSASLKVSETLEHSTNIGVVRSMTMNSDYNTHPSKFRKRLAQTGFLDSLAIGIPGETTPNIPIVNDNKTGAIAFARQTIGYSIEASPLSLLAWYNALANDGQYVRPRLVKQITGQGLDSINQVSYINNRLCSQETASKMRDMLEKVVWGSRGTGRILRNNDVRIAGKTGVCCIVENQKYIPSKKRVSFAGYFPADNPVYSCIVVVSNPQEPDGAASVSGMTVKNIALQLHKMKRF